jgi:hypothetical protein
VVHNDEEKLLLKLQAGVGQQILGSVITNISKRFDQLRSFCTHVAKSHIVLHSTACLIYVNLRFVERLLAHNILEPTVRDG